MCRRRPKVPLESKEERQPTRKGRDTRLHSWPYDALRPHGLWEQHQVVSHQSGFEALRVRMETAAPWAWCLRSRELQPKPQDHQLLVEGLFENHCCNYPYSIYNSR